MLMRSFENTKYALSLETAANQGTACYFTQKGGETLRGLPGNFFELLGKTKLIEKTKFLDSVFDAHVLMKQLASPLHA